MRKVIDRTNPSPEAVRADVVARLADNMFGYLEVRLRRAMAEVWEHDNPADVLKELGSKNAKRAVTFTAAVQDLLQSIDPNYVRVTPAEFGWNAEFDSEGNLVSLSRLE